MAATHCKHGHEWTAENTFINIRGIRECRTCIRTKRNSWKRKNPTSEQKYKSQPTTVTCPDCGQERTLTRGSAGGLGKKKRCLSCDAQRRAEKQKTGSYVLCVICGTQYWRVPSQTKSRFCSPQCHGIHLRQSGKFRDREGARNPGFKHGRRTGDNIRGWGVSYKGETSCRVCGQTQGLHLHHIVPRGKCRAARRDLRNGMALCNSCHMQWHRRTLTIHRGYMTNEEWEYVSSLTLTGESIGAWLDRYYPPKDEAT